MQPTKPAPTSAPCTDARLRHRHPRPNCLSRISGHPHGIAIGTRDPIGFHGRSNGAPVRSCRMPQRAGLGRLPQRSGLRSLLRPEPRTPCLLSEIFYVLVARSADRRAEWIKRDCTPAESRHRTVCYKPDGVGRLPQRQQPRHFPQSALSSAWRPSSFPPASLAAPSLAFVCGIAVVAIVAAVPSGPTALSVW